MYFVTGGVYDIAKEGIFSLVFGANETTSQQQAAQQGARDNTSNKTGSGGGQQSQFGGKNQFSGGNQDLAHNSFSNNMNNDRNNFNIYQENEATLQRNPNRG